MLLKDWNDLPEDMKCQEVRHYYDILQKRRFQIWIKRIFDICAAAVLLALTWPVFLVITAAIVLDSPGSVFYRQVRVTTYGNKFRIHKFRTMVSNADKSGDVLTVGNDSRITRVGAWLRKYRLDELPQLIDILDGTMSFVGTRPEVPKYVNRYTNEMKATLLLPAGITSEASILYKDEAELLKDVEDADKVYTEVILPEKMKYNLKMIEKFSFLQDIKTMLRTVAAVTGKD